MGFVSKRDDELEEELEVVDPEDGSEEASEAAESCGCECACSANDGKDEEAAAEPEESHEVNEKPKTQAGVSKKVFVATLVASIIIALVIGFIAGRGGSTQGSSLSATLSEAQLDTAVASYTYNGKKHDVSAREALESMYSIDMFADESGNYPHPSLEMITTYVRNQILLEYAQDAGLEASEEEISEYANEVLGTDDLAAIASAYQLSEDQARKTIEDAVVLQKLYTEIVPPVEGEAPAAPEEPAEGEEDVATKEYAQYIIDLLGDAWDVEKDTWANTENDFYALMGEEQFSSEGATYNQASMAYYVAYNLFTDSQSGDQQAWYNFCNDIFAEANLNIYGLFQ